MHAQVALPWWLALRLQAETCSHPWIHAPRNLTTHPFQSLEEGSAGRVMSTILSTSRPFDSSPASFSCHHSSATRAHTVGAIAATQTPRIAPHHQAKLSLPRKQEDSDIMSHKIQPWKAFWAEDQNDRTTNPSTVSSPAGTLLYDGSQDSVIKPCDSLNKSAIKTPSAAGTILYDGGQDSVIRPRDSAK